MHEDRYVKRIDDVRFSTISFVSIWQQKLLEWEAREAKYYIFSSVDKFSRFWFLAYLESSFQFHFLRIFQYSIQFNNNHENTEEAQSNGEVSTECWKWKINELYTLYSSSLRRSPPWYHLKNNNYNWWNNFISQRRFYSCFFLFHRSFLLSDKARNCERLLYESRRIEEWEKIIYFSLHLHFIAE